MTPQEAIKELKCLQLKTDNVNQNVAITVGISALEKQIPKKLTKDTVNRGIDVSGEYDIEYNYICPNCKSVVGDFEIEEHYFDYCPDCGQAIDWSDD